MTQQDVIAQDRPSAVAILTPEQVEAARAYVTASRAASTRAKYLQHWTAFSLWCRDHGHRPLPANPAVIAVHLSELATAGIARARVEAASGGEGAPAATNATAPGQAENRRTELVVIAK